MNSDPAAENDQSCRSSDHLIAPIHRHSNACSVASYASGSSPFWQLLQKSSTSTFYDTPNQQTALSCCQGPVRRYWHRARSAVRSATWSNLLFFVLCWLLLGLAACITAYDWARTIERYHRDNAVHEASELARFLGSEMERFFVPLYPLRTFVQRTRLIHLSRIAETFPGHPSDLLGLRSSFKNISTLSEHPELVADFEEVVEGIWGSLDSGSKDTMLSIQLSPRGVVTLISPLEGNEGAVGLDVLHDAREYTPYVRAAAGRLGPSVVGPIELLQGGQGLLAQLPIYVDDGVEGAVDLREEGIRVEAAPGRRFWGFATAVANLTKMKEWSGAIMDFEDSKMHFAMSERRAGPASNATGAAEAAVVDGEGGGESASEKRPELERNAEGEWEVEVEVPGVHWTLAVGWDEGFGPWWVSAAYSGGIAGAGLVALLLTGVLMSRKKHRLLLYRIMPPTVVKRLHQGRQVVQHFDNATVFFSDLVGFTDLSSRRSALEVVAMLNELYTEFDALATRHRVFKVDTIGDAYVVVGGAPEECPAAEGAARVARFALAALDLITAADVGVAMRAGLASGPVVAAVLGSTLPKYGFFGETVTVANVMESSGKAGKLQVTEATKVLLEQSGVPGLVILDSENAAGRSAAGGSTYWVQSEERQGIGRGGRGLSPGLRSRVTSAPSQGARASDRPGSRSPPHRAQSQSHAGARAWGRGGEGGVSNARDARAHAPHGTGSTRSPPKQPELHVSETAADVV